MARINQHFILNALSTIKGAVIMEENEYACDLINAYGKYLQFALGEYSDKATVSFSKELELIRAYFLLEKGRFYNLHFEIESDTKAEFEVEPFLIFDIAKKWICDVIRWSTAPFQAKMAVCCREKDYEITFWQDQKLIFDHIKKDYAYRYAWEMLKQRVRNNRGSFSMKKCRDGSRLCLRFPK